MKEQRQEEENKQLIVPQQEQTEDGDALYVAIVGNTGEVRAVTPINPDDLPTVEETLKTLRSVTVTAPTRRAPRVAPFPAITSKHTTPLPGTDSFLVITGSFGPNVYKQPSLWPEGQGFDITTPTGTLRIEGNTIGENTSLQHYVAGELGPDGLKELAGLLDVYIVLTQGQDQAKNVEVTAKQVLQRMDKGSHADDRDEQTHLLNTTLYLSRTFVIGRTSKKTRISPLLILESVTTDEYGTIWLKYHLGEEFFEAIFGPKSKLYPLPTPRIIGYHGAKSQHELLLTFFLGNLLAQKDGQCSLYFITLCLQSGLIALEKLLPGQKNRMRDAQQVIAAIAQLESDGFIRCEPHPDVDLVLAVNVVLDVSEHESFAKHTRQRLEPFLLQLKGFKPAELKAKRRIALQRLLNIDASREEEQRENPEYCTRLTIVAGDQFLLKQHDHLLPKK